MKHNTVSPFMVAGIVFSSIALVLTLATSISPEESGLTIPLDTQTYRNQVQCVKETSSMCEGVLVKMYIAKEDK